MTIPGKPLPTATDPRAVLDSDVLSETARVWLREAAASVAVRPNALRVLFPAARRRCGQEPLDAYWTVDEAARAVLLGALPYRGRALADQLAGLLRSGGPAQQRAVFKALPHLARTAGDDAFTAAALELVREALRGDDTTVVEAALGPFAGARLPDVAAALNARVRALRTAAPEEA